MAAATALAEFAILLLELACNQGGNERTFSDLLVKKTKRRNRLGLEKLEKMSKLGAAIRAEHVAENLVKSRAGRSIHDDKRVQELLSVPRYADLLDRDDDEAPDSDAAAPQAPHGLVASSAAWRTELARWSTARRDNEEPVRINTRNQGMFPRSLALLFGGTAKRPAAAPRTTRKKAYSEEILMMELLAAEYDGEPPDDGELSGSDDDYESE